MVLSCLPELQAMPRRVASFLRGAARCLWGQCGHIRSQPGQQHCDPAYEIRSREIKDVGRR